MYHTVSTHTRVASLTTNLYTTVPTLADCLIRSASPKWKRISPSLARWDCTTLPAPKWPTQSRAVPYTDLSVIPTRTLSDPGRFAEVEAGLTFVGAVGLSLTTNLYVYVYHTASTHTRVASLTFNLLTLADCLIRAASLKWRLNSPSLALWDCTTLPAPKWQMQSRAVPYTDITTVSTPVGYLIRAALLRSRQDSPSLALWDCTTHPAPKWQMQSRAVPYTDLAVIPTRRLSDPGRFAEVEAGLTFVGAVGLHDPPRPEVADAIARCAAAGIRVVIVTGDNKLTAEAIGRQVGLLPWRAGSASRNTVRPTG